MSHWFVVQTEPQRQKLACRELEALGIRTFYPRYRRRQKDGKLGEYPLFGIYIFVWADLLDGKAWHAVTDARGVRGVLGGGWPRALLGGVVDDLRAIGVDGILDLSAVDKALSVYAEGEELEVVGGPFSGHIGKCLFSKGERVQLLLTLLGRDVPVEVRHELVAPSKEAAANRMQHQHGIQGQLGKPKVPPGSEATSNYWRYDKTVRGQNAAGRR